MKALTITAVKVHGLAVRMSHDHKIRVLTPGPGDVLHALSKIFHLMLFCNQSDLWQVTHWALVLTTSIWLGRGEEGEWANKQYKPSDHYKQMICADYSSRSCGTLDCHLHTISKSTTISVTLTQSRLFLNSCKSVAAD